MHDNKEQDELLLEQGGTMSRSAVAKRLVRYALQFRKPLLLLTLAVVTDLAGPLVAKRLIDEHIAGVERPWYETAAGSGSAYAVAYGGGTYKRGDRLAAGEPRGAEARVLQVGKSYYFVAGAVAAGQRSIRPDGRLTVATPSGAEAVYDTRKLSAAELYAFYKPEFAGVLQLCAFYLGLLVLSAGFSYGQRYLLQASANRIIRRMRLDVLGRINQLAIGYFDRLPAGKIVSRMTNDTETIRELYVTVLTNFFSGGVYLAGIFVALFILNVKLAAMCLFILPVLAVWIYAYGRVAKRYNRTIRSTVSEINGVINEAIQGMPVIKAFRREKASEREFEAHNTRLFTFQNKLLSLNAMTGHNLVGFIRNIAYVTLIWYFGGASLSGGAGIVSVGVLYAFVDYLNRMFNPIVNIVNQLPNLETALVSAERVFKLLDEDGEAVSDRTVPRFQGNVAFRDVWFSYIEGEPVLKGISFEAKQGQTVALVGHTGSGKSSVLNLLFRFYDLDSGTITIDGVDIAGMPRQGMRRHMGIVLQDPFLFTGTIASNVTLDDPAISREQVRQALLDVGAERLLEQLPQGIDEPVIEKGSTLSAGQRQLVSFARALAYDPAILILDEATSNIDTETEAVIQNALEVVKKGRTTFVIAHRLSTIKSADLILVLDEGRIAERGDHESLLARGGKYAQMYRMQFGDAAPAAVREA